MRSFLIGCLLCLAASCGGGKYSDSMVRKAAARLARIGYRIDLSKVTVRTGDFQAGNTLGALLTAKAVEQMSTELKLFYSAFSPEDSVASMDLRKALLNWLRLHVAGDYDFRTRTVFLRRSKGNPLWSIPAVRRRTLVHELVHAWQDQSGRAKELAKALPDTTEGVDTGLCVLEGEAEAAATSMDRDLAGSDALARFPDAPDATGPASPPLVYSEGLAFMIRQYRSGGWDAVRRWDASPPASTEQILHPEKLGRDLPTKVELPPMPVPETCEDTLGELGVFQLLEGTGFLRDDRSWIAAAGWDGDRLGIYQDGKGRSAVVWRILWDRPEDARQFEEATQVLWLERPKGTLSVDGRCTDWVCASDASLQSKVEDLLQRDRIGDLPENAGDAETTAQEERSFKQREKAIEPHVAGGRWVHPELGLSLSVPKGWGGEHRPGDWSDLVARTRSSWTDVPPSIVVRWKPLPIPLTLKDLEKAGSRDGILSSKIDAIHGVPALWVESSTKRRMEDVSVPVRSIDVTFLRNARKITVHATADAQEWPRCESLLRAALRSIRFSDAARDGRG